MQLSLQDYLMKVKDNTLDPVKLLPQHQKEVVSLNSASNAIIRFAEDYKESQIKDAAQKPLSAVPIVIQDAILSTGSLVSCASKMLPDYQAPYSATLIEQLQSAGALILGQTNMDEFGVGASTSNSIFGASKNAYDGSRSAGGNTGGAAVAIAKNMAIAGIGSDAGAGARLSAAYNGIVGFKPSDGVISHYGVIGSSSLDQPSILSKTVADTRILFSHLAKPDPKDAQSFALTDVSKDLKTSSDLRILLPQEVVNSDLDPEIRQHFMQTIDYLQAQGYQILTEKIALWETIMPSYYSLFLAELSSNLARFDGIRYGLQKNTQDFETIDEYYTQIRTEGFSDLTKKAIVLGTYVLSNKQHQDYYLRALSARKNLQKLFTNQFSRYDLIITPTFPHFSPKLELQHSESRLFSFLESFTALANLLSAPAISLPIGKIELQEMALPLGLQLIAPRGKDDLLLHYAAGIETLFTGATNPSGH